MKPNIILGIAVAALLFSSCSKSETDKGAGHMLLNDPSRIGFGISTGSRSWEVTLGGLESYEKISIVAVKNGKDSKKQHFNEIYKFVDGKWDWTTDPVDKNPDLFKWPEAGADNYPMTFYSVIKPLREYVKDELKYNDGVGAPDMPIVIYPQVGDQEDYVAALTEVSEAPSNGRVNFLFKHLTSKVLFKIHGTSNIRINIASVKTVNVQDETSPAATPVYNPITGWVNPIITAATNAYTSYRYLRNELTSGHVTIQNDDPIVIPNVDRGALLLMPQYGTPIWKTSDYLTAADAELKDPIYEKTEDGKYTQDAVNQWDTKIFSQIKGSYIEIIYNIQNADGTSYIIGGGDKYIRVGYPLDLTVNAEKQCWKEGKQHTYTISLGRPDATGGTLLDPFYVNFRTTPTTDPIDNPKTVKPGRPINTDGKVTFGVDVGGWVDTPATIK